MDNDDLRLLGYGSLIDAIQDGKCPFCLMPIDESTFNDDGAVQEFIVTGMCGECYEKFGRELNELFKDREDLRQALGKAIYDIKCAELSDQNPKV